MSDATTHKRFHEIEGLRGFLALWVAVAHAFFLSGHTKLPGVGVLLLNAQAAIQIFMILSGFVIAHLLLTRSESYWIYLERRFLRIFPAFAFFCAIGLVAAILMSHHLEPSRWNLTQHPPTWQNTFRRVDALMAHPIEHIVAHLFLVHGMVPNAVLPRASTTLLDPAWGLSVEWQFYLIAPAVVWCLRAPWKTLVLSSAALLMFLLFRHNLLGTYDNNAVIFAYSGLFAVGIASRFGVGPLSKLTVSPMPVAVGAVFIIEYFAPSTWPLLIWAIFYPYLLWGDKNSFAVRAFRQIFDSAGVRYLGRISYSIYLSHMLVMFFFAIVLVELTHFPSPSLFLGVNLFAVLCTIPISAFTYTFIERPGVQLGHRLAAVIQERQNFTTVKSAR